MAVTEENEWKTTLPTKGTSLLSLYNHDDKQHPWECGQDSLLATLAITLEITLEI